MALDRSYDDGGSRTGRTSSRTSTFGVALPAATLLRLGPNQPSTGATRSTTRRSAPPTASRLIRMTADVQEPMHARMIPAGMR